MQITLKKISVHLLFLLLAPLFLFLSSPVFAQTPPPTCTITITPSTIPVGKTVTVSWRSTNATGGTITHIGEVAPNAEVNLLPNAASQTVFVGTFVGAGGSATCSATLTVSVAARGTTGSVGSYNTGGTYGPGDIYSTGDGYSINPSSFSTQPKGGSFSQTPGTVSSGAQSTGGGSGFLVPCGTASGVDNATSCNICSLATLTQNLINFLIMLSIPLSAALFAWAGILYFTSAANPGNISKAHKIFTSVFIGFAIALSGYLIVQTILNAFLNPSFKDFSLTGLTCSVNPLDRPRHSTISEIFTNLFTPSGKNPTVVVGQDTGSKGGITGIVAIADPKIAAGVDVLNNNAQSTSHGRCAYFVRQALAAEGYTSFDDNHPRSAYQYGQYLTSAGFTSVAQSVQGFTAQPGDVVVFQPVAGHSDGHIAMYNGTQWVSDYKQSSIFAASAYQNGSYQIYRAGK